MNGNRTGTAGRLVRLAVLSAALALWINACGDGLIRGDGAEPDPGRTNGEPTVTLRFWHTFSDQETVVFENEVVPLFERDHPNIRIRAEFMPYTDQLKTTLTASVGTPEAPDLMRMDIVWVPEFAKLGILEPVDRLEGFADVAQRVFPATLVSNEYKGRYYGVPMNTNTKVAIYSRALLEQAGLKDAPANMDQLVSAVRRLRAENAEVYGIAVKCCSAWDILPYFWTLGGHLTSPDHARATGYLDAPESVAAVEKIRAWAEEGIIGPSLYGQSPDPWSGMEDGQYLMIDDGPWYYSLNSNFPDTRIDVLKDTLPAPLPAEIGGRRSVVGGENLVLIKGSRHPAEAWEFMRFMTTEEPQRLMAATGLIPTNRKAAASLDPANPPYLRAYLEQFNQSLPRPPVPSWSRIEKVFSRYVEKIMRREMDTEAALKEAARQIDALLRED